MRRRTNRNYYLLTLVVTALASGCHLHVHLGAKHYYDDAKPQTADAASVIEGIFGGPDDVETP